jgi:hypothetical protein
MSEETKTDALSDYLRGEPAQTTLEVDYLSPQMMDDIMVMGEWNNWLPERMDMDFTPDGRFRYFIQTLVPVGYKYRFQFILDGVISVDRNQPFSKGSLIGRETNYKIANDIGTQPSPEQLVATSSSDTQVTLNSEDDQVVDMSMPKLGRSISYIHPEMQKGYEQ